MSIILYCFTCEKNSVFDSAGYCAGCGGHGDNCARPDEIGPIISPAEITAAVSEGAFAYLEKSKVFICQSPIYSSQWYAIPVALRAEWEEGKKIEIFSNDDTAFHEKFKPYMLTGRLSDIEFIRVK